MACTSNLKRQLLLSIIRGPTLSRPSTILAPAVHACTVHTSSPQQPDGISITFGPQIDRLLQSRRKKSQGINANRDRSPRKSSKTKIAKEISRELVLRPSNDHSTLNDSATVTDTQEDVARSLPDGHTDPVLLASPRTTPELSENTYTTTLKAESTNSQPQTSHNLPEQRNIDKKTKARKSNNSHGSARDHHVKRNLSVEAPTSVLPRGSDSQKKLEPWQVQKEALTKKFAGEGWNPRKRLSPDALEGIRGLHEQDPERYTTEMLSQHFKVSAEAIRRILKSKWRPPPEKMEERRQRWARRHDRIWDHQAELGLRPARVKDRKPEGPEVFEDEIRAKQMLGQL